MTRQNPYLAEYESLTTYREQQWTGKRQYLVEEYGWAVPTDAALEYLCSTVDGHLVEYGAGDGYWASLLESRGQSITPMDIDVSEESAWTDIQTQDVRTHSLSDGTQAILLIWPPATGPVGIEAVARSPNYLFYVGEDRGGCTATPEFFDELQERYTLVTTVDLPSFAGVDDALYHYKQSSQVDESTGDGENPATDGDGCW